MKLYLNGFAQTRFPSSDDVKNTLQQDLDRGFGAPVRVELVALQAADVPRVVLPGRSLDSQDFAIDAYQPDAALLAISGPGEPVAETVHTDRFRSLCPVTGQPDWASILVRYAGPAIDHASLLRYLVSFRCHEGFHETVVERIFLDLKARCACRRLLVAGYFLRRGGIDINPVRADAGELWPRLRLIRQ